METTVVDVVNATQDALVRHDVETYMSHLADDVTIFDPAAPPVRGIEGARRFLEEFLGQLPEITFLERKIFPCGRSAAMKFTIQVKTSAGRAGTLEGIDVFELDERNKIQKLTSYWNPAELGALFG